MLLPKNFFPCFFVISDAAGKTKVALIILLSVTEWEGESLQLIKISRLDMGVYLCIASNGVPPSVSKRIKVSVNCKFTIRVSQ